MAVQPWLWDANATLQALFSLAQPALADRVADEPVPAVRVSEIARHARRLAVLAPAIGRALGLGTADRSALRLGGLLHDIGKLAVPFHVLFKRGGLSAEEFEAVKSHTVVGDLLCARVPGLGHVRPIVRHHHERLDGTGYPDALRGDEIPLLAQIVGIADVYDALVHPRPYKPAYDHRLALDVLHREAVRGWRRMDLLEALVAVVDRGRVGRLG